jgi:1-deoxy-D-xylulose-5-phosphate synthase
MGGAGTAILEFASLQEIKRTIIRLGIPDKFIPHGTQKEQKEISGIDNQTIEKNIRKLL